MSGPLFLAGYRLKCWPQCKKKTALPHNAEELFMSLRSNDGSLTFSVSIAHPSFQSSVKTTLTLKIQKNVLMELYVFKRFL